MRPSLARLVAMFATLSLAACATPKYRYDRLESKDGVEVRHLEDLIADSQSGSTRSPGAGLGMSKSTLDFDFDNQKDEYRIGANDVLSIYVVNHPEMSSQRINLGQIQGTTVQKDGNIYLPVVGQVKADGMTVVEFARHLRTQAARFILEPEVSVEILEYGSQKFFVLGMVRTPGAFPVDGDTTLLEAIGLAGGATTEGDIEAAYTLRGGELLPISLADVLLRGDVRRNIYMQDGDVVFIPDGSDKKVYVLGEVQQPTVVRVAREHITLADALASAGGPTLAEGRSEIAVLRGGHAEPIVYKINLEEALLFDDQIALMPGDRVIVAPTGLSTASKYMRQLLPFLQGAQAVGLAAQGAANTSSTLGATTQPPP